MQPSPQQTLQRLEEDLETQRIANSELARALRNQEAEQLKCDQARHQSLEVFQNILKEQDEDRRAGAELLTCLQEIGEWRAEKSILRRATEVLRIYAAALLAHRQGTDQTNRFIKKLLTERDQLRRQLLEAESEVARLQILVSTPMTLEQRTAEPALAPSPSI